MFIRKILFVLIISTAFIACNSNGKVKEDKSKETYVAIIDSSMTLEEVAKANKIGEPFLRTKLGINTKAGRNYSIVKMGRLFNFSIDDLRKVIEDQKNKELRRGVPEFTKPKTEN